MRVVASASAWLSRRCSPDVPAPCGSAPAPVGFARGGSRHRSCISPARKRGRPLIAAIVLAVVAVILAMNGRLRPSRHATGPSAP